jgi:hypothetical protein
MQHTPIGSNACLFPDDCTHENIGVKLPLQQTNRSTRSNKLDGSINGTLLTLCGNQLNPIKVPANGIGVSADLRDFANQNRGCHSVVQRITRSFKGGPPNCANKGNSPGRTASGHLEQSWWTGVIWGAKKGAVFIVHMSLLICHCSCDFTGQSR